MTLTVAINGFLIAKTAKNYSLRTIKLYRQQLGRFAKHLVSRANDLKLPEMTNQLPLRKGLLHDTLFMPYFERNPMMKRFAHQAQHCRGTDYSPVSKEIFDAISQEFEASVIYGLKSPDEAVRRAAERARMISNQL